MRIGLFTDCYKPIISGVTNSVDTLAQGLRALGHTVYVITNDHERADDDPFVIRLGGYRLPMKGMKEYRIGKVTRKKVKRMVDLKLDIVHCHTEFTMGRLGRRTANKAKIPVVLTYHTMYDDYVHFISKALVVPLRFLARWYVKGFANRSNALIFPTIKVHKTFNQYGISTPSSIIPSGISLQRFAEIKQDTERLNQLKEQYHIINDTFVLLYLGRVSREKSISTLLDHIATIPYDNVKMLVVGDGPDRENFEKQVNKLGIAHRVSFLGMVPPDQVGYYYSIADVFVNFSVSETQGLTYLESLACGTPLLVKYDDNLEGVVKNGVNGFAFLEDHEFLPLFQKIYNDPALLKQLTMNADNAMTEFSSETYVSRVLEIYNSLIKG